MPCQLSLIGFATGFGFYRKGGKEEKIQRRDRSNEKGSGRKSKGAGV